MSDSHEMNSKKVLILLAVLTAVEVAWAVIPLGLPVWAMRAGLVGMAVWKGYLIFMFFMHMKFEGWIVKGLMLPTVPLAAIVVFANMPDTSLNEHLVYTTGSMVSPEDGQVKDLKDVQGGHGDAEEEHGDESAEH